MQESTSLLEWVLALLPRVVVLFAVIPVHEFAHGYVAYRLGDNTARDRGRLTLNPFHHLSLSGTVALLVIGFGWANPVPIDPRNFKKPRRDTALSALAGPMANIIMSFLFLILYKVLFFGTGMAYTMRNSTLVSSLYFFLSQIILISLYLAVFNLIPAPPLDGFKIIGAILPSRLYFTVLRYERFLALALIFLIFFTDLLSVPIVNGANLLLRLLDFLTRPLDWFF